MAAGMEGRGCRGRFKEPNPEGLSERFCVEGEGKDKNRASRGQIMKQRPVQS